MWQALWQDIVSDNITWIVVGGILVSWGFGVADIVKYGWNVKEDAE